MVDVLLEEGGHVPGRLARLLLLRKLGGHLMGFLPGCLGLLLTGCELHFHLGYPLFGTIYTDKSYEQNIERLPDDILAVFLMFCSRFCTLSSDSANLFFKISIHLERRWLSKEAYCT